MNEEEGAKGQRAVTVLCYAGYKADQRPCAFFIGSDRRLVEDVLDQWYGPDHTYFKVLTDDRRIYILRHEHATDQWTLIVPS